MSCKIGLISDPHATPGPVAEALTLFDELGVERILCPGDMAGYGDDVAATVALLRQSGCQAVAGNHERWYLEQQAAETDPDVRKYFDQLPRFREWIIEGCRIYLVHASPPDSDMQGIRLLDETGRLIQSEKAYWQNCLADFEYDVLLVGHTHQIFAEQLGRALVVNPGSCKFNHSCAVLTLPDRHFEVFGLSGQKPSRSWNWGMFYAQQTEA
jgi:putative phosphoesterase